MDVSRSHAYAMGSENLLCNLHNTKGRVWRVQRQRRAMTQTAASSPIAAVQLQISQSGSSLPHCRRVCANSAAATLLPANLYGVKFAMQRHLPVLPPSISATIPPTSPSTANQMNLQFFQHSALNLACYPACS
jgi:hypothetical protein